MKRSKISCHLVFLSFDIVQPVHRPYLCGVPEVVLQDVRRAHAQDATRRRVRVARGPVRALPLSQPRCPIRGMSIILIGVTRYLTVYAGWRIRVERGDEDGYTVAVG